MQYFCRFLGVFSYLFLSIIPTSAFAEAPTDKPLTAFLQGTEKYECDSKTQVIAHYYQLSDSSLSFVKIAFGAKGSRIKRVFTLPQVIAASGVKYSDEMKLIWWVKGDSGTLYFSNGGPEESWPTSHGDCIKVESF